MTRLVVPVVVAAAVPLVALAVVAAASGARLDPALVALSAVGAAGPFALLAGLVATTASVRPAFPLAAAVGTAVTAAGWGWVAWQGVAGAGRPAGAVSIGAETAGLLVPVAAFSVMVTVVAVRSAFSPRPPSP